MRQSSSSLSSTSSLVNRSGSVAFIHYGIGGAGNYRRVGSANSESDLTSAPTRPRPLARFSSGIGGAGNIHLASERAVISTNEELARNRVRDKNYPSPYFIGIGGAGNRRSSHSSFSSISSTPRPSYSEKPLPIGGADVLWKRISKAFALPGFS